MLSARAVAEAVIESSGIARWYARSRQGRTLVLAYHSIVPDDLPATGDRSLHLTRSAFARQLDALVASCDVVPLAAVLEEPARHARPRVAITFDDAYQGALTLGAAELRARDLPATMFVAPGLLGGHVFWWDALAGPDGLSASVRHEALETCRGDDGLVRAWAQRAGVVLRDVAACQRSGTVADLRNWAANASLTVAPHTWAHRNLARLGPDEVVDELRRPLEWVSRMFPDRAMPWLAYPYGRPPSEAASVAARAGYDAALLVEGGWIPRPPGDAYTLPRLNVPRGLTLRGYRLRLAGMLGKPLRPRNSQ